MLVELQWTGGRLVREYTFLLDPVDYKAPARAAAPAPEPAAPQAPIESRNLGAAPAPQPAPAPAQPAAQPAQGGKQYEVKKGDTLATIARQNMAPGVTLDQMLIAIYRANQEAFIRNNINLVRSGRILTIPGEASNVDLEEARRLVKTQEAQFNEYRRRLAAVPAQAEGSAGRQEVTGRIEAKPAPAPAEGQDRLRLSKTDRAGAPGAAARADDAAARERALAEERSRVADLEKNVADLQKLLELKNQQLSQLEKGAAAKPPAEASKPAAPAGKGPEAAPAAPKPPAEAPKAAEPAKPAPEAPKAPEPAKPAAEAPKPAPEAAKPPAEAPKAAEPAKPKPPAKAAPKAAPPKPEPGLLDEFLDNPLALGGLAGVIVLLLGYGAWAWRRKKASQAKFQDSVLDAASGAGAASTFGPAAASPSAASQPSVSQTPTGMEAEEVDPIAEADVYMAYGRDAQAEEILKEALAKDANRTTVHAKLLEIYANRKDAKSFEQTALKLKSLTNGAGPDWDKAVSLGRGIDPQNGLYSGGGGAAVAAPAAAPAAPAAPAAAAPTLDFDLGSAAAAAAPAPDISLDAPKEAEPAALDFDLGGAAAPAAPEQKTDFTPEGTLIMESKGPDSTASGGLDFDLGLGGDDKKGAAAAAPAPAAAPAAPAAADASGGLDFDLNLDMGGDAKKADAPTQPAPSMDLSSISLDLGESAPGAAGGDPKWQEVATKLDLAKAYEEMGDKDGARELLNEVMKDGDAAQKGQAQQLLAKIG
ncbi:MAG: LysM peptidoglycan-binding domain-containing protein [Betaproteobacteria bacterium]|nr:LysM peptidoglycan-binding domain-containing protein [Betaproteobacteria bacterium]